MLADDVAYVIGVDTHADADAHALALVEAGSQRCCRSLTIPASRRGYRQALRLAQRQAPGRRLWALEGSGSYGAGLVRFLAERGEGVLEVERPRREGRQGRLKSTLWTPSGPPARCSRARRGRSRAWAAETQALRALLTTREGAVSASTAALNELTALLLSAPPELRERLQGLPRAALLEACARLRPGRGEDERAACAGAALARAGGSGGCARRHGCSSESSPAECRRSPRSSSPGAGSVPSARRRSSSPGLRLVAFAARRPSPSWPGSPPSPRARARSSATGSIAAAIAA